MTAAPPLRGGKKHSYHEDWSQRRENFYTAGLQSTPISFYSSPHAPYILVIFPQLLFFIQPGTNEISFDISLISIFFWEFPCICSVFAFLLLMCLMAVSCSGSARDPRGQRKSCTSHLVKQGHVLTWVHVLCYHYTLVALFLPYHRKWHSATLRHLVLSAQLPWFFFHYLPCILHPSTSKQTTAYSPAATCLWPLHHCGLILMEAGFLSSPHLLLYYVFLNGKATNTLFWSHPKTMSPRVYGMKPSAYQAPIGSQACQNTSVCLSICKEMQIFSTAQHWDQGSWISRKKFSYTFFATISWVFQVFS